MSMFPVVFLLGLMCLAPVMLALAIALSYWAWQNRAHWPDPKVFLIVGGVALLLFVMLGVTSVVPMQAEVIRPPHQVNIQHGAGFHEIATPMPPHSVTVPAPVVVRHYPLSWGLMLIIGLNLLFGFGVAIAWRMSQRNTDPVKSGSTPSRKTAGLLVSIGVAAGIAFLLAAGIAIPGIQHAREGQRREAARAELHRIGEALHGTAPHVEVFPAPVEVRTDLALWSLLTVAGFLFLAVLLFVLLRRGHTVPAHVGTTETYQWNAGRKSAAGLVAFTFAMVLLGLIGLYRFRSVNAHHAALQAQQLARLEKSQAQQEAMKALSPAETAALRRLENSRNIDTGLTRISETDAASALTPLNNDPLPQADRTRITENAAALEPAWIHGRLPPSVDGKLQVISSGQFASEDEARADAHRQCVQLLATDLQPYISGVPFRRRRTEWMTGPVSSAIQQQYVQQFERDFGSFFAPMYRVWYLVELSPRVREPAITLVKAESQEGRVIAAGVVFAALWLAPLGMVLAGRTIRAMGGQSRGLVLAGMTLAVLSAWAATGLVLNEYLVIFNG